MAFWPTTPWKMKTVKFPVAKYGENKAFDLAVSIRKRTLIGWPMIVLSLKAKPLRSGPRQNTPASNTWSCNATGFVSNSKTIASSPCRSHGCPRCGSQAQPTARAGNWRTTAGPFGGTASVCRSPCRNPSRSILHSSKNEFSQRKQKALPSASYARAVLWKTPSSTKG